MPKRRVLVLCTGNSARSQMAEGLLRHLAPGDFEVVSAGTEPKGLHPLAVAAMAELGVDISGQSSKSVDAFVDERFDDVITLCDEANEACPTFPNATRRLHWGFDDPAKAAGSDAERLDAFRRVRDEIHAAIERLVAAERAHR
jgi:arsenate reductase